jgi:hypothetical protein
LAEHLALVKPMSDALERQFGWKRDWLETPIPEMGNVEKMTTSPINIGADQAQSSGFVMRKVNGLWKVTTRRSTSDPVEPATKGKPFYPKECQAIRTAIDELNAGRFKSAYEFKNRCVDLIQQQLREEIAEAK